MRSRFLRRIQPVSTPPGLTQTLCLSWSFGSHASIHRSIVPCPGPSTKKRKGSLGGQPRLSFLLALQPGGRARSSHRPDRSVTQQSDQIRCCLDRAKPPRRSKRNERSTASTQVSIPAASTEIEKKWNLRNVSVSASDTLRASSSASRLHMQARVAG